MRNDQELKNKISELVEAALIMGVRRGADDSIMHDAAKAKITSSIESMTARFLELFPAEMTGLDVPNRTAHQKALILNVLNSPDWTEGEKAVVKWQFKIYGSFYTNLFYALMSADVINLKRLEIAFPDEVAGFRAFREGNDLANKIDEAIGL